MHKISFVLLFAACFWILTVHCQGGGGGGGGGGGSSYRSSSSSRSSCKTEECRQRSRIIVYVLLGGLGAGLLVCCCCVCCGACEAGKPPESNATFVNSNTQQNGERFEKREMAMQSLMNSKRPNIFRNGMWASRYYQYGKWHGPFDFMLSFDPDTMRLRGWGWDNVGKFNLLGNYSNETGRMGITKLYIRGTGDQSENLGHEVTIQLTENAQTHQFEGKWYVQTNQYRGEDKFELKFVRECEVHEVV